MILVEVVESKESQSDRRSDFDLLICIYSLFIHLLFFWLDCNVP